MQWDEQLNEQGGSSSLPHSQINKTHACWAARSSLRRLTSKYLSEFLPVSPASPLGFYFAAFDFKSEVRSIFCSRIWFRCETKQGLREQVAKLSEFLKQIMLDFRLNLDKSFFLKNDKGHFSQHKERRIKS